MTDRVIRIGTRGSRLARWQADAVHRLLAKSHPGRRFELVLVSTAGDRDTGRPLSSFGGVGVFVKEIENALLGGRIDLAVHSLKDLPSAQPDGLRIGAVLPREDPRDAFVARAVRALEGLPQGARVGTSSVRRRAQLLHLRPDVQVVPIRGNVPTRVRKLEEEKLDGVILARAGLVRLGMGDAITEALSPTIMLPAPGQGAIAVEIRAEDGEVAEMLRPLHDERTARCVAAERAVMRGVGGGCHAPVGALATVEDARLALEAVVASPDGRMLVRRSASGAADEADSLGLALARELLEHGGEDILHALGQERMEARRDV